MPFLVQRTNVETLKDHGEVGRPFFKLKVLFESVDGVRRYLSAAACDGQPRNLRIAGLTGFNGLGVSLGHQLTYLPLRS
jgi:hypothetical protein